MMREISLFFHFIGFGLIVTLNVSGFILNHQYKSATDLQQKAIILRVMRPIGLLSPFAILLLLLTGIVNMHALGYGPLDAGWLTAKIVLFFIAAILGTIMGIASKKRGELVKGMLIGGGNADAQQKLTGFDKQITILHTTLSVLMLSILALAIYGRIGGQ